jgi:antitoxin (DNA-binding transcriptional repressor) of toxin-antitoxin stability system
MTKINLHEAKARLSHYARLVKAGETVILCDRNKPFAEIRPIGEAAARKPKRKLGLMKGLFPCPPDFDFNASDRELEDIVESGPIFPPLSKKPQNSKP